MTNNNKQSFQFDLNKAVHFRPGYEILEIRKISLEPDILINPESDDITISGVIMLQGEYEKSVQENLTESGHDRFDIVNELIDMDNNLVKFTHSFPIDISVPAHRVSNLDDMSVHIRSFDYELVNSIELNVESRLEIEGINMVERREHELIRNSDDIAESSENEAQSTNHEVTKDKEHVVDTYETEEVLDDTMEMSDRHDEPSNEELIDEQLETDEVEKLDSQEDKPQLQEEIARSGDEEAVIENEASVDDTRVDEERHLDEDNDHVKGDIDIQMNETQDDREDDVKDVHFLTTIFDRANEEGTTTLRIYIVQEGDSVQTVAKDYDMSALRLVQLNDLAHDDLTPGQLLYIPKQTKAKK